MTSPTPLPLPGREAVGKPGTWKITNEYGESITVTGELLGLGSTYRPRHQNHPTTEYAPQRTHCSTCRWTEIRIFGTDPADGKALGQYLFLKRGASIVPEEKDFIEWEWLLTGHEVLEKLTTRRGSDVFLTPTASRTLSQAAEYDAGVRDAWLTRTVK
jgi:hypothetical protein